MCSSQQRCDALNIHLMQSCNPSQLFFPGAKCVSSTPSCILPHLCDFPQAKGDLDGKKLRLARLRGTPGLPEVKVSEAERETAEAEERVRGEADFVGLTLSESCMRGAAAVKFMFARPASSSRCE